MQGLHKAVNVTNIIAGFCNDPKHFVLRVETVAQGKGKPVATSSNASEFRGSLIYALGFLPIRSIVQLSQSCSARILPPTRVSVRARWSMS